MRFRVDEGHVAGAALPTREAADLLAGQLAEQVASAVAGAMPGSESARLAMVLAASLDHVLDALRAGLLAQADSLAAASRSYALRESSIESWVALGRIPSPALSLGPSREPPSAPAVPGVSEAFSPRSIT